MRSSNHFFFFSALAIALASEACSKSKACPGFCPSGMPATLNLSCGPADLSAVTATGPCEGGDGNPSQFTAGPDGRTVLVFASGPGTCQIELNFASGFTYVTTVSFAAQSNAPEAPEGCPPCPAYTVPTRAEFNVENPIATCPEAGGTTSE